MKINKLYVSSLKQTYLNPSKEKTISVLKKEIDLLPVVRIPDWAQGYCTANDFPTGILGRIIDTLSAKKQISAEDEAVFKKAFNFLLRFIKNKKNMLGEGYHEEVYQINDKYAAKIPKENISSIIFDGGSHIRIPKNSYEDLETFSGGIVLQLGNLKILRNIGKHIPAGVPISMRGDNEAQYYRTKYLPAFSKVPQESYNAIIRDCVRLNNRQNNRHGLHYHTFDLINSNNIVLKDNKLYWVDKIISDSEEGCTTTKILNMLLNKYGLMRCHWIYDGFGEALNDARIIFKKVILACSAENLPLINDSYIEPLIWKNLMSNLKIKDSDSFVEKIKTINEIDDKAVRVLKTQELLDRSF